MFLTPVIEGRLNKTEVESSQDTKKKTRVVAKSESHAPLSQRKTTTALQEAIVSDCLLFCACISIRCFCYDGLMTYMHHHYASQPMGSGFRICI